MNRTEFLIDGFNLYHSLLEASRVLGGPPLRWLDVAAFCDSYLHAIGGQARRSRIVYFGAIPFWRDDVEPGVSHRHQRHHEALLHTGVEVHIGRFTARSSWCHHCGTSIVRHEEKETDVAIAVEAIASAAWGTCETLVFVTGDSDIAPALRKIKQLNPRLAVNCLFPYARHSEELRAQADRVFTTRADRYLQFRLPDQLTLSNGRVLRVPRGW